MERQSKQQHDDDTEEEFISPSLTASDVGEDEEASTSAVGSAFSPVSSNHNMASHLDSSKDSDADSTTKQPEGEPPQTDNLLGAAAAPQKPNHGDATTVGLAALHADEPSGDLAVEESAAFAVTEADKEVMESVEHGFSAAAAAHASVASSNGFLAVARRSPSVMSQETARPDPPPSVVDYDEERVDLDDEEEDHAVGGVGGVNDRGNGFVRDDPPPSVVDYSEERIDLDDVSDRGLGGGMVENEKHVSELEERRTVGGDASPVTDIDVPTIATKLAADPAQVPPLTTVAASAANQAQQQQHPQLAIPEISGGEPPLFPDAIQPTNLGGSSAGFYISPMSGHIPAPSPDDHNNPPNNSSSLTPTTVNVIHHPMSLLTASQSSFGGQSGMVRNSSFGQTPNGGAMMTMMGAVNATTAASGGRRKIRLRMEEEIGPQYPQAEDNGYRQGLLKSIRPHLMFGSGGSSENSSEFLSPISEGKQGTQQNQPKVIDHGMITLSWYEGTSTFELQEHVRRSVARKLNLPRHIQLVDVRVLDESLGDTPEEIVLSPFIPDGSEFLLRFSTRDMSQDGTITPVNRPPDSPSAAPSPHPEAGHSGLSTKQLAHLTKKLDSLRPPNENHKKSTAGDTRKQNFKRRGVAAGEEDSEATCNKESQAIGGTDARKLQGSNAKPEEEGSDEDEMVLHSEDPIEASLRKIFELLLVNQQQAAGSNKQAPPPQRHDRRQVVFVLANYFVLFLSLIAISAEIQARAPGWLASLEKEMKNVQNCAADQDALFECVSRGDFAGLIASMMLWLSRSVATRRVFLFGFETPQKLWTVVYESLVTATCWGFSYLFIRRGMNPDTRKRFLQKYWKDAVYGSLAGFNAAFMKQVLKNLIPQEAVEDALRERQLKILSWLPTFGD